MWHIKVSPRAGGYAVELHVHVEDMHRIGMVMVYPDDTADIVDGQAMGSVMLLQKDMPEWDSAAAADIALRAVVAALCAP